MAVAGGRTTSVCFTTTSFSIVSRTLEQNKNSAEVVQVTDAKL